MSSIKGRSYRHFDECIKILKTFDWSGFYDKTDPNDCWKSMLQAITAMADNLCPIKTFKINKARPPWMTNEILEIMKDRDYYYKKARTLSLADDWNIARNLRNRVGKMIKNLKADLIQNNLKELANDYKRFWTSSCVIHVYVICCQLVCVLIMYVYCMYLSCRRGRTAPWPSCLSRLKNLINK